MYIFHLANSQMRDTFHFQNRTKVKVVIYMTIFLDEPGEYRAIWWIFNVSIVSNSGLTILESESITFRELDNALCAPSLDILDLSSSVLFELCNYQQTYAVRPGLLEWEYRASQGLDDQIIFQEQCWEWHPCQVLQSTRRCHLSK